MSNAESLIAECDRILHTGGLGPSVSPTLESSGPGQATNPDALLVRKEMDIEKLDQNKLLLAHVLLHRFYAAGNRTLTKGDIETLHKKVRQKIKKHSYFDKLDKY